MSLCRNTAGTVTLQKGHPVTSGCKDGFFFFSRILTPQRKVTARAVAHAVPPLEDEAETTCHSCTTAAKAAFV